MTKASLQIEAGLESKAQDCQDDGAAVAQRLRLNPLASLLSPLQADDRTRSVTTASLKEVSGMSPMSEIVKIIFLYHNRWNGGLIIDKSENNLAESVKAAPSLALEVWQSLQPLPQYNSGHDEKPAAAILAVATKSMPTKEALKFIQSLLRSNNTAAPSALAELVTKDPSIASEALELLRPISEAIKSGTHSSTQAFQTVFSSLGQIARAQPLIAPEIMKMILPFNAQYPSHPQSVAAATCFPEIAKAMPSLALDCWNAFKPLLFLQGDSYGQYNGVAAIGLLEIFKVQPSIAIEASSRLTFRQHHSQQANTDVSLALAEAAKAQPSLIPQIYQHWFHLLTYDIGTVKDTAPGLIKMSKQSIFAASEIIKNMKSTSWRGWWTVDHWNLVLEIIQVQPSLVTYEVWNLVKSICNGEVRWARSDYKETKHQFTNILREILKISPHLAYEAKDFKVKGSSPTNYLHLSSPEFLESVVKLT